MALRLCLSVLVIILNFAAFAAEEGASAKGERKGFYFDREAKKYYTDGKSGFSIRPVGNADYLEKIEVSINDGTFQNYGGKLEFGKEGLYTIRFRAVDPVLNWSPVQVFNIYVDKTAPVTKWAWKGDSHTRDNVVYIHPSTKLILSAEDALAGIAGSWLRDESGKETRISGELAFSSPGAQTVRYFSADRVGNIEALREIRFVVDNQAPVTDVNISGTQHRVGDKLYVHFQGEVALKSEDAAVGLKKVEYQVNGGPVLTYSAPISVSEKTLTLKYRGIDWVGNIEEWKTLTVLQDSAPPQLVLKEVGGFVNAQGKKFAKSGFALKAHAADTESGLKNLLVSRDGKEFQSTSETEFRFDQPGEYHLTVRAIDHLGNLSESSPMTVVIDDTPPSSMPKFTEHAVERDGRVLAGLPNRLEVVSTDSGVGTDYIEYSYDGKSFVPLKDQVDLSTWKSSEQVVYFRAVDRLGNKEEPQKILVQLLTRGPVVDLFVESENMPNLPLSKLLKGQNPAAANERPAESQATSPSERKPAMKNAQ